MGQSDPPVDRSVFHVSDAVEWKRGEGSLGRLRKAWMWLLVDADRWSVVVLLAASVFGLTVAVNVVGPGIEHQYLIDGVSPADAYITLQSGILTVMTIVLVINQLVLTPDLGPLSRQRKRFEDEMSHRIQVESMVHSISSPTEPAQFLGTVAAATRRGARNLENAIADTDDQTLRRHVEEYVADTVEQADQIETALEEQQFGRIEMLGASVHYDTTSKIHRLRQLQNQHGETVSAVQEKAFEDMIGVLELYSLSREYFRTLYIKSEFTRFSRAILYTGVPAILAAHYSPSFIDPNAILGSTFGIRNPLWFEAGLFTFALLPALVLVSYVARLVTLSEPSIFLAPFMPVNTSGQRR